MNLTLNSNRQFIFTCAVSDNDIARRAGFYWDGKTGAWVTPWAFVAKKVLPRCVNSVEAANAIAHIEECARVSILESSAIHGEHGYYSPGGNLYSFQEAGVDFMLKRSSVLLADEMGVGKTIQAIMFCAVKKFKRVLVICPASLKRNWANEWAKWSTYELPIEIGTTENFPIPKTKGVLIASYNLMYDFRVFATEITWDCIILDEAHYLKNTDAQRTVAVYGGMYKGKKVQKINADVKLALTGTPFENRPIELYPTLRYLLPTGFHDKMAYAKRYCDARTNGFGWDFSGASNGAELQHLLRSTIMLRRMKKDVLTELPAKTRQVLEFDSYIGTCGTSNWKMIMNHNRVAQVDCRTSELLTDEEYAEVVKRLKWDDGVVFDSMATVRKENAIAKIPIILNHIEATLENVDKLVVFAHHRDVIKAIGEKWPAESVTIFGDTDVASRHEQVERFQKDPSVRLFIGSLMAASEGITLTSASTVVFAEFPWTPSKLTQAEDRVHRIGQNKNVLIQYLVYAQTIDARMIKYIVRKAEVADKVFNEKERSDIALLLS